MGGFENNDLHKLCSKSNSITLCRSPGMRNQVKTQKERSEGKSFRKILGIICLEGGLRRIGFKIICSKSNYIMFYRSLGMPIEVETRKEGCQGKSFSKILCIICLKRGGGGSLRIIDFKIVCFKSNSTTFYRSLGMRNQVETQKERSQGMSFSKIPCIICLDGRSENNRFQNKSLQIQCYHVL